ncbi:MAG: MFS transporter [Sneathiellaceae bacterium]
MTDTTATLPLAGRDPHGEGRYDIDGRYAWQRLCISVIISTIGGIGLWSVVVALPAVEAEFGVDRSDASLPYTATMLGFAIGGVLMGRLADRFGVRVPLVLGGAMLGIGYVLASTVGSLWEFMAVQAVFVGMLGSSASFGALVADVSLWFRRRRGIAVAIVASGGYLAGTLWPPLLQYGIETIGWRSAHVVIGIACAVTMIPLALLLRRRPPVEDVTAGTGPASAHDRVDAPHLSRTALQVLLVLAGLSCCIAMAMPQVHLVAYCADLGFGPARGAEMLSLMLGLGIVSRLVSGLLADRIGGVGILLISSSLQCLALLFYLPFDGLASLYVVSALFGLAQGGIVPSYALIVRQFFPASEAGFRISLVIMATIVGMAVGGWLSGVIYDVTGSYQAAFLNGIAFNLINISIAAWLLLGGRISRTRTA